MAVAIDSEKEFKHLNESCDGKLVKEFTEQILGQITDHWHCPKCGQWLQVYHITAQPNNNNSRNLVG